MKLFTIFFFVLSLNSWGKSYDCKYKINDSEEVVEIKTKPRSAAVTLNHLGKMYNYNKCKTVKDEIGILIDCNRGSLDFMILLNNEVRPASGGIMSSTHELFVDIDC